MLKIKQILQDCSSPQTYSSGGVIAKGVIHYSVQLIVHLLIIKFD